MDLASGDVVIVDLGDGVGREQRGRRPAVVVASDGYLRMASGLAIVVPCTSVDRGWRSHVPIVGDMTLRRRTFAMTEQVRVVSPDRICGRAGHVDPRCRRVLADVVCGWFDQPPLFRR